MRNGATKIKVEETPMRLFDRPIRMGTLAVIALLQAWPAWAQGRPDYPNKPVHLLVGFAAGGGKNLFDGLIVKKFSENIGKPVVIENKPGAGARLGAEYAMGQPADGFTLVVG